MRENSVCLIIFILFACCFTKSILADKCVPLKIGLKICCFHWFCCVSCHSDFCFCVFLALLFYEKVIFFELLPQPSQVQVVWLDFWFLLQSFSFSKSMSHIKSLGALTHTASSCLHASLFGDSSIRTKVSLWCKQLINNLRQQTWLVANLHSS